MSETQEFRNSYTVTGEERSVLEHMMSSVQCYRGPSKEPRWVDCNPGTSSCPSSAGDKVNETSIELYSTLCYVEADTSRVCKSLSPQHTRRGSYFKMEFDIILSFGLTELTAQMSWMENVS